MCAAKRGGFCVALDVESLLEPVSDDDPVGPDLSYDDDRLTIESAFESSFGDEGRPADVNWSDIIKLAANQCAATKDVWLGVYLTRAGAMAGQLETVETGIQLLDGLLSRYWDDVHPKLDEYGLQGRIGPCESFTRISEFLKPLRAITLVAHPRLGSYSGHDFERFGANGDSEDGYGMFRAAMAETSPEELTAALDRLDAIRDAFKGIDATFAVQAPGDGPNFETTYDALAQIRKSLRGFAPSEGEQDVSDDEGSRQESGGSSSSGDGGGRLTGKIDGRDDVIKAIDAICDYYRRREPGSPVPVILARARDWVSMDFLAVLEDISPTSIEEAKRVLVSQRTAAVSNDWEG
jgi:type VI secretion system ImpA family protein